MRRSYFLLILVALLIPTAAYALDILSGGGFKFDIQETSGGSLSDGGNPGMSLYDSYDGAYYLEVNSMTYTAGGGVTTMGGRGVDMAEQIFGTLHVRRHFYVPAAGGDYGRYLDEITNSGTSAVMVTVAIRGNLGSDSSTVLYSTSSGDTSLTTADTWFGTDDTDGSGDASLAHVFQGDSPTVRASSATLTTDNFRWEFTFMIPAGERRAVLTFAIQKTRRADAMTEAASLVDLPDEALTGLDDYLDDIVNFSVSAAGAPRVRFTSPYEADEGAEIEVMADVTDPESDPVTYSWDLDDDGTFGEAMGMDTVTIPAGTTDGPGTYRVGVEATDGTNTTQRYRSINILNVDPTITSAPVTFSSVGASYRYQIEVDDPGGDLDPPTFTLDTAPPRMTVSSTGLVSWTPNDTDVTGPGETIPVQVTVDDGDMGTATQMWEMTVSPNRAPTPPSPVYPVDEVISDTMPRLVVANSSDPDRDPLQYFFQIDTVDTFDSPALQESGAVDQMDGFTFWYPRMLTPDTMYFWQAWAFDGTVETEPRGAHFMVSSGSVMPMTDAGAPPPEDGGLSLPDAGMPHSGGGCAAAPGRAGGLAGLLGLAVLALALRRRRRT